MPEPAGGTAGSAHEVTVADSDTHDANAASADRAISVGDVFATRTSSTAPTGSRSTKRSVPSGRAPYPCITLDFRGLAVAR